MSESPLDVVEIEPVGDWTVVRFRSPLARIVESNVTAARDGLAAGVDAAKSSEPVKLLLDLSGVDFFGSSFIEGLFRSWKSVDEVGGEFAISNCNEHCREVLTVTHLGDLWKIYDERADILGEDG